MNLSEAYLVNAYLVGLRVDTQMHIRMFQPQKVRQCLSLGRLYETTHPRKSPLSSIWIHIKGNRTIHMNMVQKILPLPTKRLDKYDMEL